MAVQRKRKSKMSRKAKVRKLNGENKVENEEEQVTNELTDMPTVSKKRWTNKQRVLIFTSRGITYKGRHLVKDLRNLMPHTKTDVKMDRKSDLLMVNEIAEIKNCNKCVFLVGKKKRDVYMWVSNVPHGPSALFHMEYLNMMDELKFTGNCLTSSRPILSFDENFDTTPHMQLLKELFIQVFGTPNFHPKSQPFVDHVFNFSQRDGKIWFRNYQIVEENGDLVEIGPRFTMTLARILSGSFGGPVLYINPDYKSPNLIRHLQGKKGSTKYVDKQAAITRRRMEKTDKTFATDETDLLFTTSTETKT
uniref:Ribosome biogenesis protein BRX1 homolog n=1 Tax=Phallusia mammillata TaxID=59560 RepID=A0A6F9D721_9ASCI|nr:ribosome biogenesis protein BRX1 homolog [Phallusia mammillata]